MQSCDALLLEIGSNCHCCHSLPLPLHRMADQDNIVQIVQVAVGVRPIEDMPLLCKVLGAAEPVVPQGAPEWVKVYSLRESYLTHFVIFMQMANGQWRKLERNGRKKMCDGGVRLTEDPDNLRIGTTLHEGTTLHDRTMIVAIENIAIDLEFVKRFQKQQEKQALQSPDYQLSAPSLGVFC